MKLSTRPIILIAAMAGLAADSAATGSFAAGPAAPARCFVYVATESQKAGEGISRLTLDLKQGLLGEPQPAAGGLNPFFLALHPTGNFLYATCLAPDASGKPTGGVAAFAIDRKTGALRELNRVLSGGTGTCHLMVDQTGTCLVVASCGNGRLACIALNGNGSLKAATSIIQHEGVSVSVKKGPQPHSINLDPGNHFAFAPDCGLDRIFAYRFDPVAARLTPHTPAEIPIGPRTGPRHFAFHPNGRFAYLINELNSTVVAFAYDGTAGALRRLQDISTLPADFAGKSAPAEIALHPNGKFLYGTNRGHDSIAMFAVDDTTGRLMSLGQEPSLGLIPQHFVIDPTGAFMLVANRKGDLVVQFRIDRQTGKLQPTGQKVSLRGPSCMMLVTAP